MNPLGANTVLTFGRYRGFKLIFVPSVYLFWLADRVESETMKTSLIEIATFNHLKELRQTNTYTDVHDFAMEMSEGFVKHVKVRKIAYDPTKR